MTEDEKIEQLIWKLTNIGWEVAPDGHVVHAYKLHVRYNSAVSVYMYVVLNDWETGADIAICVLNVQPQDMRRKGFGTKALKTFLDVMDTQSVVATQVQSDEFWLKMGFVPTRNRSNNYRYQPSGADT